MHENVAAFLRNKRFAVAGASKNRAKFGNKCLRTYLQRERDVVAIHPSESEIEGVPAFPTLSHVPQIPDAVTIVTPPAVTEGIVTDAARLGIRHLWMQPGAESAAAIEQAERLGINVIHGGPCLLVELGFREGASS